MTWAKAADVAPATARELQQLVTDLTAGQYVRATYLHLRNPVVGVVRASSRMFLADSPVLFLDNGKTKHMVRSIEGRPSTMLVDVEVLNPDELLGEDRLDVLADLMRGYTDLKAARQYTAEGTAVRDMLESDISAKKAEILGLIGEVL